MFAGIVENLGIVTGLHDRGGGPVRLDIRPHAPIFDELPLGASVAVNGACLTLASRADGIGGFDVIPETWRATNLHRLGVGDRVNLERSLRVGDRIDGHFVQGHVDGLAAVDEVDTRDGEWKLWTRIDERIRAYLVRKGSVTLDGVSLTIVDVEPTRFSVALIPTTLEHTTLGDRRAGDLLNIESDILARMLVARMDAMLGGALPRETERTAKPGITWDTLRDAGYVA